MVAPDYHITGDTVPAFADAPCHSGKCGFWRRQPQEQQHHSITFGLTLAEEPRVRFARTRRFESKALARARELMDSLDQQSPGGNVRLSGMGRRNAFRDLVRVDEFSNA